MRKLQKHKNRFPLKTAFLALCLSASCCAAAYGGEWKRDENGWWYQNDDGTWQANGWFTDGDGKSYYFDENGYMLSNTVTPDGQRVGADGALMIPVMSLQSNKKDVYYKGLRKTLDAIPLYPQESTGYAELDAELDRVFAEIITEDMDTHDKLKACYDYLITHTEYDMNAYFGNSYIMAYGVLVGGTGVCDDYSAAFAVMARKIGVPVYTVSGTTHKSNGDFTGHTWCQMDYNGVTYIFDPQIDDVIANGRGGSIMYIRFGGTTDQLADKYNYMGIADDFSQPASTSRNFFGGGTSENQQDNSDHVYDWEEGLTDEEIERLLWDLLWGY